MISEAAILRAENGLPSEHCWLLYEKYADKLPLTDDEKRNSPAPPYEPYEYPQQMTMTEHEYLNELLHSLTGSCKHCYEASMILSRSVQTKRGLVYLCLLLLMGFTVIFVLWVAVFK